MIITSKLQSIIYENPDEEDKQSSVHNSKIRAGVRTKSIQMSSLRKSDFSLQNNNEGDCVFIDNDAISITEKEKNENNYADLNKAYLRSNSCQENTPKKYLFAKKKKTDIEENNLINYSLDSDLNTIPGTTQKINNSDINSNNELKSDEIKLEIQDYIGKSNKMKEPFDYQRIIKFNEVWAYFSSINIDTEKKSIEVEDLSKMDCITQLLSKCFKQYALLPDLKSERDRIFCLTKIAFEETNIMHKRLIESIYDYLTQDNGNEYYNWELIGFHAQPKNDLKEVGVFGLIQIIAFIDRYPSLSLGFFNFLKSIHSEWIFAILLLNITKIILDLFKAGILIRFCNKQRKVLSTLNNFYYGAIFHISKELVSQNRHMILDASTVTIQYMSHLINEITEFAEKNPAHFFWNSQQLNDMYPQIDIKKSVRSTFG